MRKTWKRLAVLMISFSLLAVLSIRLYAYFSSYVRVKGERPVSLHESVRFKEEKNEDGEKHLMITADEGSDPVFVRVKVFTTGDIEDRISYGPEGYENKWELKDDGYLYSKEPLEATQSIELDVKVDKEGLDKDSFDIVVVYEYVPALFDGENWYADWDNKEDISKG